MKRFLTGLLVTALLVTSTAVIPSSAAIKEGGKCTKLGSKASSNGLNLVCVKKKNSQIWQTVKRNKRAIPKAPSKSNSLSNSSSGSTSIPSMTPSQISTITRPSRFEDLDAKTSWRFVYDELQKRLEANRTTTKPIAYEYIYGPTVNKAGAQLIQGINKKALTFFSDVFNPVEPIIEFYGTELDEKEWREILIRLDGNLNRWFYVTNGKRDPRSISGAAGKGYVIYMMGSKSMPREEDFLLFAVHETAHVLQNFMTPNGYAVRMSHDSNGEVTNAEVFLPILFLEGHADFVGYNVGYPDAQQSRTAMSNRAPKSITGVSGYPLNSVEDVIQFFENWENPRYVYKRLPNGRFERESYAIYYYGNIALTGLTAVKGYEPMHQFFLKVKSGIPYRKAFEDSYGFTLSEFYRQIAPYVLNSVRELSKN